MRRWPVVLAVVFLIGCAGTPTATPAGRASPTTVAVASPTLRATPSGATSAATPASTAAPPTSTSRAGATPATPSARPASPTSLPATPSLTPGQIALAIENVGNYRNAFGVLYFFGEIVNTGDLDVANPQIAVTLLGDTGQPVASGQANTIGVSILPAGQRTVWAAPLANAPAQWNAEQIQPQAVAATAETRAPHAAGLVIEHATASPPADPASGIAVAGVVRNGGTAAARFPLVTVGCYDAGGKLIMVDTGPAQQQEIAPGATAPFRVAVPNLKETPARVVAYAKGSAVR